MHSIFDLFQLIASNIWLYGGAFIVVLSILVFVHEWGHYIVAVKNGVKIDSFSIGFGKELFGYTDQRGTRWKFSLIPLGGYVKMFGDVDPASASHSEEVKDEDSEEMRPLTEEEKKVAFFNKSVGARAAIVFAGPAINFLFAIVLMAGLFIFVGEPVTPAVAGAVIADSPAYQAKFQPHDVILSIDGVKIRRFEDIRREVMIALDTPLTFTVQRDGKELQIVTTPEKHEEEDRFGFKHSYGLLGIISQGNAINTDKIAEIDGVQYDDPEKVRQVLSARMGQVMRITLADSAPAPTDAENADETKDDDTASTVDEKTPSEDENDTFIIRPLVDANKAMNDPNSDDFGLLYIGDGETQTLLKHTVVSGVLEAFHETYMISASTLEAIGQMFTGTRSATELGGLIRIGAIAGDMAKSGLIALISFTALLSINLGLINLFPIPMLDGGHLVFYGIEAVRGAPLSEQVQEYAFRAGLAVLVALMLFANLNDIVQILM